MKSNELMLGDWVFIEDAEKPNGLAQTKVVYLTEDNTECLHPIPLTKSIFEANGWDCSDSCYWYLKHPLNKNKVLQWYKCEHRLIEIYIDTQSKERYDTFECRWLRNVHLLQHAFRLCGLSKLADNFKIE